jgi:hypothetical protein
VSIDARGAPHLGSLASTIRLATRAALLLGVVLVAVGIACSPRPRHAVARTGRWALTLGIVQLVALGLVSRFVLAAFGAWPDVAAALLRGATGPFLVASAALAVAGGLAIRAAHRRDAAARMRERAAALDDLRRRTTWQPPPRADLPGRRPGGRAGPRRRVPR